MTLVSEAQQFLQAGRTADAERLFERALLESPDNVDALNAVGLAAFRAGNLARAKALFERAAKADPLHAITQHHLGAVCAAEGDFAAAAKAQANAVRLDPNFFVARLHLGIMLERLDDVPNAATQYLRSLQDAQAGGRWQNADTTPPPLRPLVEHAVLTARAHRREVFIRLLEPLIEKHGVDSLQRVFKAVRIYLKEEAPVLPDDRQQPLLFYFPDLPTFPYLDRSLFPWIPELEAATPAIRDELRELLPGAQGRERVFRTDALEQMNLRGADREPTWNGYYFYRYGERRDENCNRCPATARALDRLPLCRVPGQAPEVLFSVFTAGTHLLPHRGVTNTRLVAHLPLIVPRDCALSVGGEVHHWKEGGVVVFDDTYEHEAWNRSDQTRVVLIFDVWNPHLTEPEREAVVDLTRTLGDLQAALETA